MPNERILSNMNLPQHFRSLITPPTTCLFLIHVHLLQKLNQYKKEGKLALKHMWFVIAVRFLLPCSYRVAKHLIDFYDESFLVWQIFAVFQVIVSIAVAAQNDPTKKQGGLASASFAAIWSMLMVVAFTIHGAQIVFGGQSTEIGVGYMIGVSAMMCQLFFVLMCAFFVLATDAQKNGYISYQSDAAFGSFCLLNMIIYLIWAIILSVHRRAVISPSTSTVSEPQPYEQDPNDGNVVNPDGYGEDEAEL